MMNNNNNSNMVLLGALAGDIIGSVHEYNAPKTTEFPLFTPRNHFTDDSILTLAVAEAIVSGRTYLECIREYALAYPHGGYGGFFREWMHSDDPQPYNSFGNGSAMRVSRSQRAPEREFTREQREVMLKLPSLEECCTPQEFAFWYQTFRMGQNGSTPREIAEFAARGLDDPMLSRCRHEILEAMRRWARMGDTWAPYDHPETADLLRKPDENAPPPTVSPDNWGLEA